MSWEDVIPLIDKARAGDPIAFGTLVERFQPAVYAVALARLRDVHEAIELTPEVFIHAMKKLGRLRDPHCFVGWLRQIAVRMAIEPHRAQALCRAWNPKCSRAAKASTVGPLDDMVREENRGEIWAGLDQLKPLDKATLVAFYIQGRTLKQMSREFETPVGTIKRRLHVARIRLKKVMEGTKPRKRALAPA
ncbi:MAG: sigma-70 family RNA polymerase sigma factor [Gemmataceae bacterium]